MTKLRSFLLSPWTLGFVGVVLFALLVWFLGPLIGFGASHPLDGVVVRVVIIVLAFLTWGGLLAWRRWRARRQNAALVAEIAAAPQAPSASAEEVAVLRERLTEALGTLKKAKLGGGSGRRYLYELPWYIIIGPPGAGKTTALANSGLRFPLGQVDSIRGIGGTRNCDWWFTDEAVLLDTAGRYTTQDSDQSVDAAGWTGFLNLLKRYRPRQPINGVLIAISIADIAGQAEAERRIHARTIRQRIRELYDTLAIRIPIYVLFTKVDLLAGFVEFFDDLGREEREQVWGMTFALDEGKDEAGAVAHFGDELDALIERLNARMVERVHAEPDVERRSLIYTFPGQVASLLEPARDFLTEIFRPSRLEERPFLRGVYFTSGTQEGTPIDRMMGALAATFGVERQRLTTSRGPGRSYFLTRLLRDVAFAEAGLAGADSQLAKRQLWLRRAAFAGIAVASLVLLGLWTLSYFGNKTLIADTNAQLAQYQAEAAKIPAGPVADSDLAAVLPALDILRNLPAGYGAHAADKAPPLTARFGLYQGEKLGAEAGVAYRRALNGLMLPRMLVRLEDQIAHHTDQPEYLYQALKVYLMLGAQGPMDPALVREWMALDWNALYPGDSNEIGRTHLRAHLDALLDGKVTAIPLNGDLVDKARAVLRQVPLSQRAYTLLKSSPAARGLSEWRVADHAGPAASRVFVRRSGQPLTEGVPGFYTYAGFHRVFLPALGDVSREVSNESWVLGENAAAGLGSDAVDRLENDILALYCADYVRVWDALLSDLTIKPFTTVADAADALNAMAGPASPLRMLLVSVAAETNLTKPDTQEAAKAAAAKQGKQALTSKFSGVARLQSVVGAVQPASVQEQPGAYVDQHFADLRGMVGGPPGGAPIDDIIRSIDAAYGDVSKLAGSGAATQALASGSPALQALRTAASRAPAPVGQWVGAIAQGGSSATVGDVRQRLNALYKSDVLPVCTRSLQGRYPVFRSGGSDVALLDFARVFGPQGVMAAFFDQNLRPYVDTTTRPWRWVKVDNVDLGFSGSALVQFQRASEIRDAFFPTGGSMPSAQFELTPTNLDSSATRAVLEAGSQSLTFEKGAATPAQWQWPAPGPSVARLTIEPPGAGGPASITRSGPWAFFHLLDAGDVSRQGGPDQLSVRFRLGGRTVGYLLRASSVLNPFTSDAVEAFRCPPQL